MRESALSVVLHTYEFVAAKRNVPGRVVHSSSAFDSKTCKCHAGKHAFRGGQWNAYLATVFTISAAFVVIKQWQQQH